MPFIMVLVLFLSGCATTEFAPQQAAEEIHPRIIELDRQLAEGRISNVEHARGKLELVRQLYPNHAELHALRAYGVLIAGQLDRGEITPEMRDYLWEQRRVEFYRQEDERNVRLRQQSQQGGVTASDLLMFDAIRRPFERMRAPTNCQTRNVAGVQYTDCY
ncbi:hypothetical protein [Nitrosospira multiformis]|nr:hypothetical protein [Nitrosospira multiformis]